MMANERPNPDYSTGDMLAGLSSPAPDRAWKHFLDTYSPTIMLIAREYEHGRDRLNDCYLFVCEKLSDRDFRRLRQYRPEGSASFRSWLNVVVANLCIDWRRQSRGRARPFRSIAALPEFDQLVFKYRIQQRLTVVACMAAMQPRFPNLTEPQLVNAASRINAMLTPRQHFLLSARRMETVSLSGSEDTSEPVDPAPDPETNTRLSEQQQRLAEAMGKLPPRSRLLLKLRFEQELSLKEVARLMRLGDPFRARRKIQSALDQLEALLQA